MKAATTKRYYVTNGEIEQAMDLEGLIETVHQVTPYEKDQDGELKKVDYIITTVIDIEDIEEKVEGPVKAKPDYLDRHIN